MALKTKQYLENSWYRGASQDRQTGYAAQFQYGENVNVRDMKNGVCLSGGKTRKGTQNSEFSFFTYNSNLYTINQNGQIIDGNGTVKLTISEMSSVPFPMGIQFKNKIYITGVGIYEVTPGTTWTYTDISPQSSPFFLGGFCILNYANTFLLIGSFNQLWKLDRAGTLSVIREFENSFNIYGLTQEGNYLKIYTSNGVDTKIHYTKGTFDVEETGLVQTVTFNAMAVGYGSVTSDQGNDYVLFETSDGEHKLAKISGYNKTDIRWTQKWGGEKIFVGTTIIDSNDKIKSRPNIMARDGVLFCSMDEGIWTFTEYNGWLWGGCVEFACNNQAASMFRFNDKLYVCEYDADADTYTQHYYDLSFHPETYQKSGFIIGRVFDGGCGSLFKKNVQATVTYNMPVGTEMELSYRYDRSSFSYEKSNFLSIKKLTDTNECYDIIFPTTPGTQDTNLLALQSGDNILLENGNNILLEDLLVCPFNKTWNYLEYRVDFTGYLDSDTNTVTKTPILFEHSLLYDDRIRKYR